MLDALPPVYLLKNHRHSVVCEQRVHELAILFPAPFGVKLVNAV